MDSVLNKTELSAISVAAAMLSLFLLSRLIEIFLHWWKKQSKKNKIKKLLLYEVRLNVDQIENSIKGIPSFEELRHVFELKGDTLLLAPFTDDIFFFNDIKRDLDVLDEEIFWEVMKFYSLLKSIEVYSHAVAGQVFASLSVNGKMSVVQNFAAKNDEALAQGRRVIDLLKADPKATPSS